MNRPFRWAIVGIVVYVILSLLLGLVVWLALAPGSAAAACEHYAPNPPNEPTGVKGCTVYGEGFASMWGGPGIARNDCVWPFTGCQPIRITSLDTGISVDRTPTMYGDLYTGTPEWRIVDLDPATVAELGLDPARGLWRVTVEPIGIAVADVALPDTAMQP